MTGRKDNIETYREFAKQHYPKKDSGHDFRHIERIISRLVMMSEGVTPPPKPHRLYFLACFHGMGRHIQDDAELRDKIHGFLRSLDWDESEIEAAFGSLLTKDPKTPEELIVHDANFYEILGAFGVAKAFTTGGAFGQSYEETVDIFENRILNRITFRTPAGRCLARERIAYTKEFLERLKKEW